MNYRHDFHAGNFADVFKHIVLSRLVDYLKRKDKAFRVVDTHAGSGRYDLPPAEQRDARGNPPEWVGGIGRLAGWQPQGEAAGLLAPYLSAVFGSANDTISAYPGSPLLVMELMRKQDRLTACELHPEAAERLKTLFAGNYRARILELDGWLVPGSQLPPKEKRGLLLIDPPFEEAADFDRMAEAARRAAKRWSGGVLAFWYPLKHAAQVARFKSSLKDSGISDLTCVEIEIRKPEQPPVLNGCGMILRHAPFVLEAEMKAILPQLASRLEASKGQGRWRHERLTGE